MNGSYQLMCVEFEQKNNNIGLPTFKLSASSKNVLRLTSKILFLTISLHDC